MYNEGLVAEFKQRALGSNQAATRNKAQCTGHLMASLLMMPKRILVMNLLTAAFAADKLSIPAANQKAVNREMSSLCHYQTQSKGPSRR